MRSSFFGIGTVIFGISAQFSTRNFTGNGTFSSVYTSKNSLVWSIPCLEVWGLWCNWESGWGCPLVLSPQVLMIDSSTAGLLVNLRTSRRTREHRLYCCLHTLLDVRTSELKEYWNVGLITCRASSIYLKLNVGLVGLRTKCYRGRTHDKKFGKK